MSEPSLNPYASPAVNSASRPRLVDLFRGVISDVQWNDPTGALRTGLRILVVAMCLSWLTSRLFEVNTFMSLQSDSNVATAIGGPAGIAFWRLTTSLASGLPLAILIGLIFLLRGSPVPCRRIGTACVLIFALHSTTGFALWFNNVTLNLGRWSLVWPIAWLLIIVLQLIWLRRLSLTESTRQLAGLALGIHVVLLALDLTGSLAAAWFPQSMPAGPLWLGLLWAFLPRAALYCLHIVIVTRVLGEHAGYEASANSLVASSGTV